MAGLTLSQASKASGKSKSTLSRAIKVGRLSATRLDDGNFSIDPAELFRAYPATSNNPYDERPIEQGATPLPAELQSRIRMLEMLLEKEREAIAREREISAREREISADLKEDRDKWRQQANGLLTDLRKIQENKPEARPDGIFTDVASPKFSQTQPRSWLWRIIKLGK